MVGERRAMIVVRHDEEREREEREESDSRLTLDPNQEGQIETPPLGTLAMTGKERSGSSGGGPKRGTYLVGGVVNV